MDTIYIKYNSRKNRAICATGAGKYLTDEFISKILDFLKNNNAKDGEYYIEYDSQNNKLSLIN